MSITIILHADYELTDKAKQMLAKIRGKIAIISIAGKYREGKSFLLNRLLLEVKKGFEVGGTINAQTKGIWIWN